jgi:hypothetical protein
MKGKVFFDTTILIYAVLEGDTASEKESWALVQPCVSPQPVQDVHKCFTKNSALDAEGHAERGLEMEGLRNPLRGVKDVCDQFSRPLRDWTHFLNPTQD